MDGQNWKAPGGLVHTVYSVVLAVLTVVSVASRIRRRGIDWRALEIFVFVGVEIAILLGAVFATGAAGPATRGTHPELVAIAGFALLGIALAGGYAALALRRLARGGGRGGRWWRHSSRQRSPSSGSSRRQSSSNATGEGHRRARLSTRTSPRRSVSPSAS